MGKEKTGRYTTHTVRVHEPGGLYYIELDRTVVEANGDFLVLKDPGGELGGVWNKDCVVYCVPDGHGPSRHKVRVKDPGASYQMIFRDTRMEIRGDFLILWNRDGSKAGFWARGSIVYCVPALQLERSKNR